MSTHVTIFRQEIQLIARSDDVVKFLAVQAEALASRVNAPKSQTLSTRAGIGPRGAYSQVMMKGPGALSIEFGNRRMRPIAPLRKAMSGFQMRLF